MTPTWYDILGVDRTASPEQVKAAWRRATDAFEPGSGSSQFRMFNEAADVLLDPARRTAYDAELDAPAVPGPVDRAAAVEPGSEDPEPTRRRRTRRAKSSRSLKSSQPETTERAGATVLATDAPDAAGDEASDEVEPRRPRGPRRRAGLGLTILVLGALSVLAALAVAAAIVFAVRAHHDSQVAEARDEAPAAAERGMTALLAYDYRQMDADRNRAERYLTSGYRKSYLQTFKVLDEGQDGAPGPAEQTKTVVTADVLDTAVVDAEPDRVRVLVYVNQTAKKGAGNPTIFQNRAAATMVKQGSTWLIDDVQSY